MPKQYEFEIKLDDLANGEVINLLQEHLTDMYATSPPESVHALNINALKATNIAFYSCWKNNVLLGCAALKELDTKHIELKSMRTASNARNIGVASALLQHLLIVAKNQNYQQISLETGSMEFFKPARQLYKKFGFEYCAPFGHYKLDSNSKFMSRNIPMTPQDAEFQLEVKTI